MKSNGNALGLVLMLVALVVPLALMFYPPLFNSLFGPDLNTMLHKTLLLLFSLFCLFQIGLALWKKGDKDA